MEEKKELSMEVRLLLAFLLMGIVLFVTPYFYKQPPPQPSTKTAVQTNTDAAQPNTAKSDTGKTLAPPVSTIPPTEVPGQLQAKEEETFAIDTDLYRVTFSNRGATVRSWILKNYKDQASKPVDLVNARALAKVPGAFAVMVKGQTLSPDPNMALFQVQRPDNLTVNFQYSDGRLAVKKSFHFSQKSYLVTVSSEVSQNGAPLPHGLAWRGGFGDSTVVNPANYQQAVDYDVANSKLRELPVKNAKDGPVSSAGQYSFAGLEDAFFAGVYLPEGQTSVELTEFADSIPNAAGTEEQRVGASVGGEGSNVFTFFAGPKDYALLHLVNPKLDQLINWGWFEFLAKPLFLALYWTAVHVTSHNYGWAIIALTIAINMLLFPLKLSSMKSSRKMQSIQPLVNAINDKYKGLPMKDPRQSEKQTELMDLYKKHGYNPVGGCLPMLIQLPFFIAFYKMLQVTIELRGASFLWVHDLSQPETLAIRLLPIILVVTQFVSQKMTPAPGVDPAQQKMMMFMPLIFGYMFYFLQSGLVLYYLTSNMVGIAQQWILNRISPPPAVINVKPAPKKKSRN
jgi:YidC/Oxa1 family membrane protein insertase